MRIPTLFLIRGYIFDILLLFFSIRSQSVHLSCQRQKHGEWGREGGGGRMQRTERWSFFLLVQLEREKGFNFTWHPEPICRCETRNGTFLYGICPPSLKAGHSDVKSLLFSTHTHLFSFLETFAVNYRLLLSSSDEMNFSMERANKSFN